MPVDPTLTTNHPEYKLDIANIIRSNLTPKLKREAILDYHENDIAAALDLLTKDERMRFYRIVDAESLADILEYSERFIEYLDELSIARKAEVLAELEVADAVEYLRQLDRKERNTLTDLMGDIAKTDIAFLASFDEDEIGSRMSTNFIAILDGADVRRAMKELVTQAAENDNISTIYVVDQDKVLLGAIDLKDLIIARESTPLESIIVTSYPYVYTHELIEDCIERIKDYSEDSIPVLDADNKLRGVLTAQDITQFVDDEFSDDYAKLAGLSSEEDINEPLSRSIQKRLPWLIILLGLGLVVSSVVGLFEEVVRNLVLIVSFQSLILDMAGNVGTQSLAVTIRVLMDEELGRSEELRLVGKEARVGLINGIVLGLLSFILIGSYLVVFRGEPSQLAFAVSLCTGTAILVAMFLSSISGTIIPITFKKIGIDPAVASGPLITTINDLIAVVTYYGLAWALLIRVV
jgi:magnesium transporter